MQRRAAPSCADVPPSVATPSPAAATIQPVTAADLGPSWHPGCPIDPPHGGQLSGGDDELSMEDNNTSAYNCRVIPGSGRWSRHAFGRAVDLNPLLNPEIDRTGAFQPENAAPYLDRTRTDPGVLHAGDPVVRLFTDRGWSWGGDWRTPKDYQHFER